MIRTFVNRRSAAAAALAFWFLSLTASAQTIGVLPDPTAAYPRAESFAVTLPAEFVPDKTPGRYICRRYPLDAANITVEVVNLAQEKKLTNAEKRALESAGETILHVSRDYAMLTASAYEEAANAALTDGLSLKVSEFVHTTTRRASDGVSFPGFRIRAELSGGKKPILEEIYIVLSEDRLFTVTYAQASDDEFDGLFRKSASTIAVY
ncbi:MAG: hypothetical protein K5696_07325 [Lachnospiraceae bacterium]|nr:hypothetical protein [Lachnospiraceae bacterium]